MGNTASASDSDDDFNIDYKEEDAISDAENELEKDIPPNLDLRPLFDHVTLRAAASKVKDEIPENVLQQHSSHLIRWLEERQQRNEETVTFSQFYDVLMSRKVEREDCVQAFQQFDSEGDGTADVSTMIEVLKSSSGVDLSGDLGHVVRTLQACSLTPGFIDVYNENKDMVGQHGARILNFLLRNRASSSTVPYPILNGFNNTSTMRLAAVSNQFLKLKDTATSRQREESMVGSGEELKPLTKCWSSLEVSSNKADVSRLSNGDFSSYWQSDGSARSHWIRMRMKSNVVIKQLSIGVASNDQSYMPQVVTVSVGKNPNSLKEIKEVRIPSHITGDVMLLENAKMYYPIVQINLRRCHSDGCDARIHSIKTLGFRIIKEQGVSVTDAAASWYLQVLASTAAASLPVAPQLQSQILVHSKTALKYMAPLSLCPASTEKPAFLSQHVLGNMEKFLEDIACKDGSVSQEGLEVLLSFSVARGSVAGIVKTLRYLQENKEMELNCGSLLRSMESVKDTFWKKQGQTLNLTLAGCDGGQKDETSGPHNVLTRNWATSQPYLSDDSKTKVNMFFQSTDCIQLTKLRIKVDKGPRGPKRGMVFVYNSPGQFVLQNHVKRLQGYDSWNYTHYSFCNKITSMGMVAKEENPIAYFSVEDEWDEVEIPVDRCVVGQYVCIKFMEPRQSCAERLGVVGVKFYGFNRRSVFIDSAMMEKTTTLTESDSLVRSDVIINRILSFLVALARDQAAPKKSSPISRPQHLDMTQMSIALIWKLYQGFGEHIYCKNLTLQLLHALFPFLSESEPSDRDITETFFKELCKVVDTQDELEHANKDKKTEEGNNESSSVTPSDPESILLDGLFLFPDDRMDIETKVALMTGRGLLGDPLMGPGDDIFLRVLGHKLEMERQKGVEPPSKVKMEALLGKVAKQVIVDGAAVFFPDKEARSKQLFTMMTDVNGSKEALSVMLTFQSLCQFFSSVDPSGLLDLPSTLTKSFKSDAALQVMDTLISVAFREFKTILDKHRANDQSVHLVNLLCSLQTSLLCWCYKMIDTNQKEQVTVIQEMIAKYVELLTKKSMSAFEMIEEETTIKNSAEKETSDSAQKSKDLQATLVNVESSFLATTLPQCVLVINHLGELLSDQVRVSIMKCLMKLTKQVKDIGCSIPEVFYKADSTHWRQLDQGEVVLRTWEVESSHNYENNQHVTQIFSCPGASLFIVEFDARCETEKRYDYLEFTDARGSKTRYDQKVGTEKWPNLVTFRGGHKLQFLFHSDSSNNEWGYKFKVIAKGCPDVPLNWLFDLNLSMAKLYGRLCGTTLDVSKVLPKSKALIPDSKEEAELELLKSELWTTLFRGGYRTVGKLQRSLSGKYVVEDETNVISFITEIAENDGELSKSFLEKCKEHCNKQPQLGGEDITSTCNAVFAALLWHTQSLREDLDKYMKAEGDYKISDGIYQAYNTAESLRTYMLDLKQKQVIATEKAGSKEVTYEPVSVCKEKATFLLKFAGLTKVHLKPDSKNKLDRKASKLMRLPSLASTDRIYRIDIAMEKYPSFKLVMDFIRDPAWSKTRVEQLLQERSDHANAVSEVYLFASEYLRIMTEEDVFQVPNIVFLQELFSYQLRFAKHYADGMEGCGLELESRVRTAYYTLARRMVESVRSAPKIEITRNISSSSEYFQACSLHLLDIHWQMYDLEFLQEIKLSKLYMDLSKTSVSMREKVLGEIDEKAELEEYKRNMEWLEECKKEFFKWYDKQNRSTDNRKAVQMFVARFCDLLDVEISCDGCGTTLPGRRYRCLQCPDMDLCSPCYAGGVKPGGDHNDDHEIVHLMYKCDECQAFIVGTRIHCEECEDFDLCMGCQSDGHFPACHSAQHKVKRIPLTKLKLNKQADSSLLSYIHQHVWLSFVSLALSMANILYSTPKHGHDHDYVKLATQIHNHCIELANKCLDHVSMGDEEHLYPDESLESVKARQEEAFAVHSQERVLGLLGAMIPAENKTALEDDLSFTFTSEEFLSQLFTIARGETGHEENTQHFAMGLIGQLLQKAATLCQVVDNSITLDNEEKLVKELEGKPPGYKTSKFLFNFGATCLERSGLEWANSMANILQKLFNSSTWREVLLLQLSESIRSVRDNPELSSIFALFVIAGFPEVLSVGSQVKYTDLGTEFKQGVVLKHFPDKNQTLLVDRKNRKRRTIKDEVVECVTHDIQVLEKDHLSDFIDIIKDITNKLKQDPQEEAVESIWVLSLSLKALLKTLSLGGVGTVPGLYSQDFIQCIVFLASQGTDFSRQWLLKDLEVLSLTLYTKDKDKDPEGKGSGKSPGASPKTPQPPKEEEKEEEGAVGGVAEEKPEEKTDKTDKKKEDPELEDPWEGIDDTARLCFKTLEEHLKIPVSVLRAIYDMNGQSTNALLMAVHENIEGEKFEASQEIMMLARKWENPEAEKAAALEAVVVDKAVDTGMQLVQYPDIQNRTINTATEEPSEDTQKLIASGDNDIKKDTSRQRKLRSAALLKKEQDAQGKSGSRKFLTKVNTAMAVLYARQVLASLLADWPEEGHTITADLLGCKENSHVPFVLDLLNRIETKELFQKVVQNVIKYCATDSLVFIASTSCQFMEEINLSTVTKESKHNYDNNCKTEDKIHIPGASHLSIKFDSRCCTEEACDELTLASSSDYKQDKHVFSGNREKWVDFDMPGDTLYVKFVTDVSNNDWGYKFTVSGGKVGRFETGYMILNGVLSVNSVVSQLQLSELWHCLIFVACKQTGQHRLKSLQLLLKIMQSQFKDVDAKRLQLDLTLLRPLWKLYNSLSDPQDATSSPVIQPITRALTEVFLVAENLALDWEITDLYVASLQDDKDFHRVILQGVFNIAAISNMIGIKNKATIGFEVRKEKLKDKEKKSSPKAKPKTGGNDGANDDTPL